MGEHDPSRLRRFVSQSVFVWHGRVSRHQACRPAGFASFRKWSRPQRTEGAEGNGREGWFVRFMMRLKYLKWAMGRLLFASSTILLAAFQRPLSSACARPWLRVWPRGSLMIVGIGLRIGAVEVLQARK